MKSNKPRDPYDDARWNAVYGAAVVAGVVSWQGNIGRYFPTGIDMKKIVTGAIEIANAAEEAARELQEAEWKRLSVLEPEDPRGR